MNRTEKYLKEMRDKLENLDTIYLDEWHDVKVEMNKENIDKLIELNRRFLYREDKR